MPAGEAPGVPPAGSVPSGDGEGAAEPGGGAGWDGGPYSSVGMLAKSPGACRGVAGEFLGSAAGTVDPASCIVASSPA